ncbi:predicted protein, partial [Naegleria gruberi]
QVISCLLTSTGIFSTFLTNKFNINLPTLQNAISYTTLLAFYFPLLLVHKWCFPVVKKPWKYIFFAFADVEANFLVVKAYQYTTITSVMLLDCFTIPSVMLLSFLFLNRTYRWTHIVGVLICLTGLGLLVLSDYLRSISEEHHQTSENPWYYLLMGDAFCIVGSFCYAIKVSKPRLSDNDCAIEYLGMVGLFGTIIAIIQTLIFEREDIMNTKWTPQSMMYMAGFAASMFFIYTLVPHLIRWSSATFMNLSFLTSDIFAVIASVFLFGQSVYPLYYFAYAIIAIGLVFYNLLQEEERKSK